MQAARECHDNPECVKTDENPDGIPRWKSTSRLSLPPSPADSQTPQASGIMRRSLDPHPSALRSGSDVTLVLW
jgi:hypothetical protein